MTDPAHPSPVSHESPTRSEMVDEVLAGLAGDPPELPCKYFYDATGSALFDRICKLPEYYPTRAEITIMRQHAGEIAKRLGPEVLLIEYGSGSSLKTGLLLEPLVRPAGYVPVDISGEHLAEAAGRVSERFPGLAVLPICADFTAAFEVPSPGVPVRRRVAYFPGSTIGNFGPDDARALLTRMRETVGKNGLLLIGVDLKKDVAVLEAAYNDSQGVTAAFNLNLLTHLNRAVGSDFDPAAFRHRAFWEPERGRIEMHLVSQRDQTVRIGERAFALRTDDAIRTECSHKYTAAEFRDLAAGAGFGSVRVWTDPERLFSVHLFRAG